MWIRWQNFEALLTLEVTARAEARVLGEQNKVLQTHLDWLRIRVNQLEKERASLLFKITNISFAVPEMVQQDTTAPANNGIPHSFDQDQAPSFEDPGDEIAAHLGIEHTPDGRLKFTK